MQRSSPHRAPLRAKTTIREVMVPLIRSLVKHQMSRSFLRLMNGAMSGVARMARYGAAMQKVLGVLP